MAVLADDAFQAAVLRTPMHDFRLLVSPFGGLGEHQQYVPRSDREVSSHIIPRCRAFHEVPVDNDRDWLAEGTSKSWSLEHEQPFAVLYFSFRLPRLQARVEISDVSMITVLQQRIE